MRPAGFTLVPTTHFFVPGRAALVHELLQSMDKDEVHHLKSGVLLTGPNGVGKSAVGLQAFLCCLAQGRFAVYIADAKSWVAAARTGRGDEFLLELFFMQNVDKIAASPELCAVFAARLRGIPLDGSVMGALRTLLDTRPGPAVAVIVDEVQNIKQAIANGSPATAAHELQRSAAYFGNGWASWNADNLCFVRMDIASSHGTRELKLPSGDEGRLRLVRPWPLETAAVALAATASPAFVRQAKAHARILHIAGGVVRRLIQCRENLPAASKASAADLDIMEFHMREIMMEDCGHWLRTQLDDAGRLEVARTIVPLFRGKVSWALVKGAYDAGLVALLSDSNVLVSPVSPVAASVLHQQLAAVLRAHYRSLESIESITDIGFKLERPVRALLDPRNQTLSTKRLNGKPGPGVHVRVDYMLPFHELNDMVASASNSILYIPDAEGYPCDAIVLPPTAATAQPAKSGNEEEAPILVMECSEMDPRTSDCVSKCMRWFEDRNEKLGLISQLKAAHPGRPITILLFWPGKLEASRHEKYVYQELVAKAVAAGVELCVLDGARLQDVGVVL